jgi:hypothetical protein
MNSEKNNLAIDIIIGAHFKYTYKKIVQNNEYFEISER